MHVFEYHAVLSVINQLVVKMSKNPTILSNLLYHMPFRVVKGILFVKPVDKPVSLC